MTGAALTQITGATLARDQRDGTEHALLGSLFRLAQRANHIGPIGNRQFKRFQTRIQAVKHRFIPWNSFSSSCYAFDPRLQCRGPVRQGQLKLAGGRCPHLQEKCALERPAGAAHR